MTKQTEAQRLAAALDGHDGALWVNEAAAELRRLESEIQSMDRLMRASVPPHWKSCKSPVGAVQSYIAELEAANAELLESLKKISAIELQMYGPDWAEIQSAQDVANEAIKKHGGQS